MNIRRGNLRDSPTVQRFNQALFEYEHDSRFYEGDTFNLNWPYEADGIKYFTECLDESPGAALFLAEDDGRAIGYLAASYYSRSYRTVNPIGYLDTLYVAEPARGRGVGTALIAAFKEWAAYHKVEQVRVSACALNRHALAFYHKNGFTDLDIVMEQPLPGASKVTEKS